MLNKLGMKAPSLGLPVAFIGVVILFGMMEPRFLDQANWFNIGRQGSYSIVLSLGLGLVMIAGGLDLSIGSTMSLASVMGAIAAKHWGVPEGILCGIATGSLVGLVNGTLIAGAGIPPFIATLATLSGAGGLALVISGGLPVYQTPDGFDWLGTATVKSVPVMLLIAVAATIIFHFLLVSTRRGRHVFAIGGDERAAWMAGVNVRMMKYELYLISGTVAGIAGVMLSSRVNSGQPALGQGSELLVVAAVLVGGVRLGGGEGSLLRVAFAAAFLATLNNGLNLTGVQSFWQLVVIGALIASAAVLDSYRDRGLRADKFLASLFIDVRAQHSRGALARGDRGRRARGDEAIAALEEVAPSSVALELQGVSKAYGGVQALRDVSFTMQFGEITAIVGDNGAGKSTILKTLSGVTQPDGGGIYKRGRPVRIVNPRHARRLGIEIVHQDLGLVPTLSVSANMFLGQELLRGGRLGRLIGLVDRTKMDRETSRILRDLKIDLDAADRQVSLISGGQRQAIAIGRGVHIGQDILLLDEPTAALGVVESTRVLKLLSELREKGLAILLVSHRLDEVVEIADDVVILRQGQVIGRCRGDGVTRERVLDVLKREYAPGEDGVREAVATGA